MLTRFSLLSLLLIVAIGLVVTKTYRLWVSGPWDLPNQQKAKASIAGEDLRAVGNSRPIIGTETIVSKNIFDPERGARLTREAEANSQAFQRIRSMVLLGTALLGNSRFAILQDKGPSSGAASSGQSTSLLRIKLGDAVEGFKLSEISERRVVFVRGSSAIELPLDFFRKLDGTLPHGPGVAPKSPGRQPAEPRVVTPAQPNVPRPRVPRAVPALPRRDREPAAGE